MKGSYKLILGDCLEEMRKMPDGAVDVIFTSPPYNDSGYTESDIKNKRHIKYNTVEYREDWFEWQCQCIDEMLRVAKRQVLYNIQTLLSNKEDVYKLIGHYSSKIHTILTWYKPNAQPQHYPHRIGNFYEWVIVLKGKKFDGLYINSNGYQNVIVKNINTNHTYSDKHRAVMNQDFSDEIIREFTLDGETVLDPFSGLATTGISCVNQGRNYIGIEINEEYYKMSQNRIEDETRQISIFDLFGS